MTETNLSSLTDRIDNTIVLLTELEQQLPVGADAALSKRSLARAIKLLQLANINIGDEEVDVSDIELYVRYLDQAHVATLFASMGSNNEAPDVCAKYDMVIDTTSKILEEVLATKPLIWLNGEKGPYECVPIVEKQNDKYVTIGKGRHYFTNNFGDRHGYLLEPISDDSDES